MTESDLAVAPPRSVDADEVAKTQGRNTLLMILKTGSNIRPELKRKRQSQKLEANEGDVIAAICSRRSHRVGAEENGSRTHPGPHGGPCPDLKSGRPTGSVSLPALWLLQASNSDGWMTRWSSPMRRV